MTQQTIVGERMLKTIKRRIVQFRIRMKRRFIRWLVDGVVEDSADGGPVQVR